MFRAAHTAQVLTGAPASAEALGKHFTVRLRSPYRPKYTKHISVLSLLRTIACVHTLVHRSWGKIKSLETRLSIHSSAGDHDNTCADDKDRTDYVEDRGTDTTGLGKFATLSVLNSNLQNTIFIGCPSC